jgi:hypothetical protein
MNYLSSVKRYYSQKGLKEAPTDLFFEEYKHRLVTELKKRNMKFEVLF